MISEEKLKEICETYGIEYQKLVKSNRNILNLGEYEKIISILDYLKNKLGIISSNIEKCPSILYFCKNLDDMKNNWEFLKEKSFYMSNVETCLHILYVEHKQLVETYNYIMEKYGVEYLNNMTSILSVPISRIKEIEDSFSKNLKPINIFQAAVSSVEIQEIEKILKVCKKNKIEITRCVFLKSADEIERILEVCKRNKIEITGSVFQQSAEEIEKTVKVCKQNGIEMTGSVFFKKAYQIEKIALI